MPAGRASWLLRQICRSFAEAHSKGLVHRDVKGANVMICERGGLYDSVKVLDFGLVKDQKWGSASSFHTRVGVTLGTPIYLAPELIDRAAEASTASDLYALGVLACELVTGASPFERHGRGGGSMRCVMPTPVDRWKPRLVFTSPLIWSGALERD